MQLSDGFLTGSPTLIHVSVFVKSISRPVISHTEVVDRRRVLAHISTTSASFDQPTYERKLYEESCACVFVFHF